MGARQSARVLAACCKLEHSPAEACSTEVHAFPALPNAFQRAAFYLKVRIRRYACMHELILTLIVFAYSKLVHASFPSTLSLSLLFPLSLSVHGFLSSSSGGVCQTVDNLWAGYGMFWRKRLMPFLSVANHYNEAFRCGHVMGYWSCIYVYTL